MVGQIEFVGSFPGELPHIGLPEVAFAGRSNVGKSSLLNTLTRRKNLARTSRTPGRTQAINLFRIGDGLVFADLPGYGFAKVPEHVRQAWKPMIEAYLGGREDLRLVVVLVDVRRTAQEDDGALLWGLTEARIPHLVVATKVDKLKKQARQKARAQLKRDLHLPAGQPLPFSSLTGDGRDALWSAIEEAARRPREVLADLPGPGDPDGRDDEGWGDDWEEE